MARKRSKNGARGHVAGYSSIRVARVFCSAVKFASSRTGRAVEQQRAWTISVCRAMRPMRRTECTRDAYATIPEQAECLFHLGFPIPARRPRPSPTITCPRPRWPTPVEPIHDCRPERNAERERQHRFARDSAHLSVGSSLTSWR